MIINPYLNFHGNTEEAFNFYKSVFGGEFSSVVRFSDMGSLDKIPDADKNKIMHIAIPIGGNILMGTDTLDSMGQKLNQGDNFFLSVYGESKEEADKLHAALSEGGTVFAPMKDEVWGDYFGMLKDKFGIQWMVIFTNRANS